MLIKLLPENMTKQDYIFLKERGVDFSKEYNVTGMGSRKYQGRIEDCVYLSDADCYIFNNTVDYFEPVVRRMTIKEIEQELGYWVEIIG